MPLNPLNHHYSMENPASVYDEEAMTALELAGRTTAKVNETVEAFNQLETETTEHLENQDKAIQTMNTKTMPALVTAEVLRKIASGEFDKAIDDYAGNLEQRVDNLLGSVTEGSTTMDAEVIDLRTAHNNRKYPSAGTATREQFKEVMEVLSLVGEHKHIPGTNLIDYSKITPGYINGGEDGNVETFEGLYCTDFIPVDAVTPFYWDRIYSLGYCAYYDGNYNYIGGHGNGEPLSNPLNIPTGAKFARFTIADEASLGRCWINIVNGEPATYKESLVFSEAITNELADLVKSTLVTKAHNPATNYINRDTITKGAYVSGASGELIEEATLDCTDFVDLAEKTTYYHGSIYNGYCAFYNENKEFIGGVGIANDTTFLPNPFTTPAGTKYARFSLLKGQANSCWVHTANVKPGDYKASYYLFEGLSEAILSVTGTTAVTPATYAGHDIMAFNRGLCIGDSLTSGTFNHTESGDHEYVEYPAYSYPAKLARLMGCEVRNLGEGGATSAEWYAHHKSMNLSGYDFAIIQLGVNDLFRYGGWSQTSIDGFTNIITKVKNENPGIKIFVATVMPAIDYPVSMMATISDGIRNLVDDLGDPDVILIDLATYGNTIDVAYNCGHLSAYGYSRLAQDYYSAISYYMNTHKEEFRSIQFIGTTHTYED